MAVNQRTAAWERRSKRRSDAVTRRRRQLNRMYAHSERLELVHLLDKITQRNEQMEQSILQLKAEVEKVFYDPLTGIYNRRFLDENLERLIKTISRAEGELSLMMIDVDYFKEYNDLYGHVRGDACLKIISKTLQDGMKRAEDFIARYGGDEILVVLPNCKEEGAHMIAHRLLDSVTACQIPHEKNSAAKYVTVSIGVATGHVEPSHGKDDFIRLADAMLYQSKQRGRNTYTLNRLPRTE